MPKVENCATISRLPTRGLIWRKTPPFRKAISPPESDAALCLSIDRRLMYAARVSSLSLMRYRDNDYSVPTGYSHREVVVRGYVHEVVSRAQVRASAVS